MEKYIDAEKLKKEMKRLQKLNQAAKKLYPTAVNDAKSEEFKIAIRDYNYAQLTLQKAFKAGAEWMEEQIKQEQPEVPHWKPSEEQMDALKEASASWMNQEMENCELLESLYDDLKSFTSPQGE